MRVPDCAQASKLVHDMKDKNYDEVIKQCKIPTLVLDQKWHRLFAISGKPEDVKTIEQEEKDILLKQSHLTNELKSLKKIKADLMQSIVDNMEGKDADKATEAQRAKIEQDKRLIDETNEKIEQDEDMLMEIPKELLQVNRTLMLATMNFCYAKLRTNSHEIAEISDWITNFRVELKKNIIKKQNREINNREIYSYMHDVFGPDVMELFDVKNEDSFVPEEEAVAAKPEGVVSKSDEKEANKERQQNFDVDSK